MKAFLSKLWHFLLISAAVIVIIVAALFGVARALLPFASDYRAELESYIASQLKTPVRIGEMDVEWHGWEPRIRLGQIALTSADGNIDLLRLRELFIELHLGRALLAENLQIANIQLDGVRVIVQRNLDGSFSLRGLGGENSATQEAGGDTANLLGFMLLARRIDLLNATIVLSDAGRGIQYVFPNANVSAQNIGDQHRFYAQADLPDSLGERIELFLDFKGDGGDPATLHGRSYISGQSLKLVELLQNLPALPVIVQSGSVDVEQWAQWSDGKLQEATTNVQVNKVSLLGRGFAGDANSVPWDVDSAHFQSHMQRNPDGWDLAINPIRIQRRDQELPTKTARFRFVENTNTSMLYGQGDTLPLADTVDLIHALLGDPDSLGWQNLAAADIEGTLSNWRFALNSESLDLDSLRAEATLNKLRSKASGDIPGIENISGQLRGAGNRFELALDSREVSIDAQPLMRESIALDVLAGDLAVVIDTDGVFAESRHLAFENSDLKSEARVFVAQRADAPLFLDMQVNFRNGSGVSAPRYLPVEIMDEELIEWLDAADIDGEVTQGTALFRGAVDDFPFYERNGVFDVESGLRDASLTFDLDWPRATGVDARMRFFGPGAFIDIARGTIHGSQVLPGAVQIVDLENPILEIDGKVASSVPEVLQFARRGPLADELGEYFEDVSGTGPVTVSIDLDMSLEDDDELTLDGSVELHGAELQYGLVDLELVDSAGIVRFNENALQSGELSTSVLGERVYVNLTQPDSDKQSSWPRVLINGTFPLQRVFNAFDVALADRFGGESEWHARWDFNENNTGDIESSRLVLHSNLSGTAVRLPEPLAKSSDELAALELNLGFNAETNPQDWSLRYGNRVMANGNAANAKDGITVTFGEPTQSQPEKAAPNTVRVRGVIESFDLAELQALIEETSQSFESDQAFAGSHHQVDIDLDVAELRYADSRIEWARVYATGSTSQWQIGVDSLALTASTTVELPYDETRAISVRADHFDYGVFAEQSGQLDESDEAAPLPSALPALDIQVARLVLWDSEIANVAITGAPQDNDYVFDQISAKGNHYTLNGAARWQYDENLSTHTSELELRFDTKALGEALTEIGYGDTIAEGRGYVEVKLNWPDALTEVDPAILNGSAKLRLRDGRILEIDPGAGRLVGLLAFQELPRRLLLDFGDVLSSGMEFEKISGRFGIEQGIANTEGIRLEGTIGVVELLGDVDLVEQTYDQQLVVLPRITASAPWLAVLSGGLSGGLTVLLADEFLKELGIDLDAIGRRRYTLTGSWDNPQLDEILPPPIEPAEREK
ncbi:MAG: YhdP family protein [Pseudomonadota bacterium]